MAESDATEMTAVRRRFGKPSRPTAIYVAVLIVGTNAYLLYLALTGESTPLAIGLFGVVELVAYSLISNATMLAVPPELRVGSPDIPLPQKIIVIAVMTLILFGILWIGVGGPRANADFERLLRDPLMTLDELHILRPLAVATLMAASGSVADWVRWRGSGAPFVNGLALMAAPKFLTALLGPVIAMAVADGIGGNHARTMVVWCVVYVGIRSGLELLFLYWQFLGMPERQRA